MIHFVVSHFPKSRLYHSISHSYGVAHDVNEETYEFLVMIAANIHSNIVTDLRVSK